MSTQSQGDPEQSATPSTSSDSTDVWKKPVVAMVIDIPMIVVSPG